LFIFKYLLDVVASNILLLGYVNGNATFPQPLSEEEEEYYLRLFNEQGDLNAKSILIERNLRLVAHIVKKYSFPNKDIDDLISVGTVGLIKAINSFDSSKGTRLATYAARCIENEILMLFRSSKKTKGEVFLQDPIGTDKEGNEVNLIDIIATEDENIAEKLDLKGQIKNLYEKIKNILKGQEKDVIALRYGLWNGEEMTQREIAHMLGISRSYVSRIEKKALKKLKNELKE